MEYDIQSADDMQTFGEKLAAVVRPGDQLELIGDIGAGKTTLVKGLAKGLGAHEDVASPSFTISRVYDLPDDVRLYHYDFYRLSDAGILRDELAEVMQDPRAIVVIEWADIVDDVLPEEHIRLTIRASGENSRRVLVYGIKRDIAW